MLTHTSVPERLLRLVHGLSALGDAVVGVGSVVRTEVVVCSTVAGTAVVGALAVIAAVGSVAPLVERVAAVSPPPEEQPALTTRTPIATLVKILT